MKTNLFLVFDVITIIFLLVVFFIDNIIIHRVSSRGATTENKYILLNRSISFAKSFSFKAAFLGLMFYYLLVDPPARHSDPYIFSWMYIVIVFKFLKNELYIINDRKKDILR